MNVVTPPQSGVPLVGRESGLNSFFADEKSLLDLLITIRSSKIKDDEKLYLRDLVLEYTQLRDPQKKELVKDELAKLLDKYQITITSPRVAPTQSTTIGVSKKPAKNIFGARRLNPVFRPVAVMTPKSPEVASVAVTNKTHIDPVTNDQIVNKTAEENVMAPHVADPQGRISEIKRLVNSKVGNPINLISSDNNIGREYMNALLDAMKKTSGSALAGELDVAMARLEKAYLGVEELLSSHPDLLVKDEPTNNVIAPTPDPVSPEPAPPEPASSSLPIKVSTTTIPLKEIEVVSKQPNAATAITKEVELPPEEVKQPKIKATGPISLVREPEEDFREVALAEPKPSALSSLAARLFVDRSQVGVAAPPIKSAHKAIVKEPVFKPISPKNTAPLNNITAKAVAAEVKRTIEPTLQNVENKPAPILTPVTSDSSVTKKITSFRDEMKKREAEDKLPVTQMNAPEVTAGLSQLLSEWKLFKSSGFLGTGPNGIDHPMFQKLRALPMASVIAGRFEGATPEVKQSITDYMNGWRYEQGLIHEMGETFENYLRRVILHILERQTNNPKA